jgi:hypothetical protein
LNSSIIKFQGIGGNEDQEHFNPGQECQDVIKTRDNNFIFYQTSSIIFLVLIGLQSKGAKHNIYTQNRKTNIMTVYVYAGIRI